MNTAICEACGRSGPCEVFGRYDNPKAMLLCALCTEKEVAANDVIVDRTKVMIENPPFASLQLVSGNPTVELARNIDASIKYNGDFFNAKTIANQVVIDSIMADESIGTIQERQFAVHKFVSERLQHFKFTILAKRDEEREAATEQLAWIHNLRQFGEKYRMEVRETIKANDANYQPQVIVKAPKIPAAKKNPMDRLIEAYALMHGISILQAKLAIEKGKM